MDAIGPGKIYTLRHGANGVERSARTGIGKASRLKQDVIECPFALHKLFDGSDACILDAAAQTAVCKLKELLALLTGVIGGRDVDGLG